MQEWESSLRPALVKRAALMGKAYIGKPGFPDPEDFAQEVLRKLWGRYGEEKLRNLEPPRLFGLAYQVLRNSVVDEIRKLIKVKEIYVTNGEDETSSALERAVAGHDPPDETVAQGEMSVILDACLVEELTEKEREFLLLSFELDSAPKAKEECGWPPGDHSPSALCHRRRTLLKRVTRCLNERIG